MPPVVPEHPSVEELGRFGSGQIDPGSLERISVHVESCEACRQTLAGLKGDTLEGLVRAVGVPANGTNDATDLLTVGNSVGNSGLNSAVAVPERLGDYRIVRVLGQGGMGTVYEAVDERLKRRVALKVMRPEIAARPEARSRFIREAQTAAALEHDHVVAIYQVGEEGGVPYLAMPLLKGESLEDRLKAGGTFTLAEIVRIGRQMAEGLAAAHERGLIHRDIKPANIWLESMPGRPAGEFRVKILDFGLARLANDDTHLTGTGTIVGTPAYMAPEQARGDTVDGRADLFSLGCVLYRLSTGKMAFRGETTMAILMSLANDHPSAPRELRREIPASLSDLTVRLLAKNPTDRPTSAQAVIELLHECDEPAPVSPPRPAPEEQKAPPKRGFPWAVATAVGALALLILAGVVFFWQTPDGVVRIECDDPNIKIAFDEGELKVVGAYKEPLSLKPGKHGMKIQRGDFEFETDKLIVNRGDKVVLRIEATPGKVQVVQAGKGVIGSEDVPPAAVTQPNPVLDRKAAEWVLTRRKGFVGVRMANSQGTGIAEGGQLPTEPFQIVSVQILDPQITDLDLSRFAGLSELTHLNLSDCQITDSGLAKLVPLPRLTRLALDRSSLTGEGFAVFQRFPALRELVMNDTAVSDEGLKHLANLPGLEKVYLKRTKITEAGIKKFAAALPKCKIEWDGGVVEPTSPSGDPDRLVAEWVMTRHKPELSLLVNGQVVHVGENGKLPTEPFRIRGFAVIDPRVVDDDLNRLTELTELTSFNLHNCTITDAGLAKLVSMTKLNGMNLERTKVTEAVLPTLRKFPALRDLVLNEVPLTEEGLKQLAAMPGLEKLSIKRTQVTEAAVKKLAASLPRCKIEWDGGVIEPTATFSPDRRVAELFLQNGGAVRLDQVGANITNLEDLPAQPFKIARVYVVKFKAFGDADLAVVAQCSLVDTIFAVGSAVTDEGLKPLPKMQRLTTLMLGETGVTDSCIPILSQCKLLILVDLTKTNVSPAGVKKLAAALPKCQIQHDGGVIEPTKDGESDRKAAEYIIASGNGGWIEVAGKKMQLYKTDKLKLPAEPFLLREVLLATKDEEAWSVFQGCKNLTVLTINSQSNVSDAGLSNFKECRDLKELNLNGNVKVTDEGLAHFKDCKKLTRLLLVVTKVTDAGLAHFKDCTELSELDLNRCLVVTDTGLLHLKGCRSLTLLDLAGLTKVTDVGFAAFKDCRFLTTVNVVGTAITDQGLAQLQGSKFLTTLNMGLCPNLTDAGLAALRGCDRLESIFLAPGQMTAQGLNSLKDLKRLESIGVQNGKDFDKALAPIGEFKNLKLLRLLSAELNDAGLAQVAQAKSLVTLHLQGATKVTDDGMKHVAKLGALRDLSLGVTNIGDAGVAHLVGLEGLRLLNLAGSKVTADGVKKLAAALPKCKITWDGGTIEPGAATGFTNTLGLRFALVPKGKAWLGGGGGNVGQREVAFAKDFYLGVYEVTQDEWQKIMGSNPSRFSRTGDGADVVKDVADADLKQLPVEMVSWDDCQEFLKKLNEQAKDTGWTYRLPTEDEWEYACRGGPMKDASESAFSFYLEKPGNQLLPTQANFGHDKGLNRPTKVGSYAANKLGIYDLHGNVSEWTADAGNKGGDVPNRVTRGGSFDYGEAGCGVLSRDPGGLVPTVRHAAIGLRVVRVPSAP